MPSRLAALYFGVEIDDRTLLAICIIISEGFAVMTRPDLDHITDWSAAEVPLRLNSPTFGAIDGIGRTIV